MQRAQRECLRRCQQVRFQPFCRGCRASALKVSVVIGGSGRGFKRITHVRDNVSAVPSRDEWHQGGSRQSRQREGTTGKRNRTAEARHRRRLRSILTIGGHEHHAAIPQSCERAPHRRGPHVGAIPGECKLQRRNRIVERTVSDDERRDPRVREGRRRSEQHAEMPGEQDCRLVGPPTFLDTIGTGRRHERRQRREAIASDEREERSVAEFEGADLLRRRARIARRKPSRNRRTDPEPGVSRAVAPARDGTSAPP